MMLLDTCAVLWLAHDQSKLSTDTLRKIESAPVIYLSAISGFEIGLKVQGWEAHPADAACRLDQRGRRAP